MSTGHCGSPACLLTVAAQKGGVGRSVRVVSGTNRSLPDGRGSEGIRADSRSHETPAHLNVALPTLLPVGVPKSPESAGM